MKCIKAIKATKHTEVGEIRRVDNEEADLKVGSGLWKFIPKVEWKEATRKKVESVRETNPANVEGTKEFNEANSQTIAQKQLNKKKKSK
jgi:hypothetical protein